MHSTAEGPTPPTGHPGADPALPALSPHGAVPSRLTALRLLTARARLAAPAALPRQRRQPPRAGAPRSSGPEPPPNLRGRGAVPPRPRGGAARAGPGAVGWCPVSRPGSPDRGPVNEGQGLWADVRCQKDGAWCPLSEGRSPWAGVRWTRAGVPELMSGVPGRGPWAGVRCLRVGVSGLGSGVSGRFRSLSSWGLSRLEQLTGVFSYLTIVYIIYSQRWIKIRTTGHGSCPGVVASELLTRSLNKAFTFWR